MKMKKMFPSPTASIDRMSIIIMMMMMIFQQEYHHFGSGLVIGGGGVYVAAAAAAPTAPPTPTPPTPTPVNLDSMIQLPPGFQLIPKQQQPYSSTNTTTSSSSTTGMIHDDEYTLIWSTTIPSMSRFNANSVSRWGNAAARYEFRIRSSYNTNSTLDTPSSSLSSDMNDTVMAMTIFGFPHEMNNNVIMYQQPIRLLMSITTQQQLDLLRSNSMTLEVWCSGMQLNIDGTKKISDRNRNRRKELELLTVNNNNNSTTTYTIPTYYDSKLPTNTPKLNVYPANRGKYMTRRLSYNLPSINITKFPVPIEVVAEVYTPINVSSASPLVLFLHGFYLSCYKDGPNGLWVTGWPCSDDFIPVPSYQGYRYVGDILASQGYIAVSISANGINGQDSIFADGGAAGRAQLIRHHLELLAKWNNVGGDPWNNYTLRRKIDMNKVVLVGHSRGGEGINRIAIDATPNDPYKIVGLININPTTFNRQVTPDIHSATILGTCDGDASTLEGQAFVDMSRDLAYSEALRSAITVIGANHNYFNTEWTPGLSKAPSTDDWTDPSDPVCGNTSSIRLTPKEQQKVGATYTAALVRLAVNQDMSMLPLLDGSNVKPAGIGKTEVSVNTVGGAGYRLLYVPGAAASNNNYSNSVQLLSSGMNGFVCRVPYLSIPDAYSTLPQCASDISTGFFDFNSPHAYPGIGPPPMFYELQWSTTTTLTSSKVATSSVRFNLPIGTGNLSSHDWINLRIANDPNKPPARFDLMLTDHRGKSVNVQMNSSIVDGWPGTGDLDRIHARVIRGRLQSSTRIRSSVDLSRIVSVTLISRTLFGRVWLLDIAITKDAIVQPTVLNLPVVSVVNKDVPEGDVDGVAVVQVVITPPPTQSGEVWLYRLSTFELFQLNITAGSTNTVLFETSVSWKGNTVYDEIFTSSDFIISNTKGVVTSNAFGGVTVIDDDPVPIVTAVSTNVTTVEGQSLHWTLELSAPTNGVYLIFNAIAPSNKIMNELHSDDVDPSWLDENSIVIRAGYPIPSTPQPLSLMIIALFIYVAPNQLSFDIDIPILMNNTTNTTEGDESICLKASAFTLQPNLILTGTVLAH